MPFMFNQSQAVHDMGMVPGHMRIRQQELSKDGATVWAACMLPEKTEHLHVIVC